MDSCRVNQQIHFVNSFVSKLFMFVMLIKTEIIDM